MLKKMIFIYLVITNFIIFSTENIDVKISQELLSVYGENITLKQIEKVLEFDENNHDALIMKARILDNNIDNLNIPKELLEKTDLLNIDSRYHYISILYRLGKYENLIEHVKNLEFYQITDSDIMFYIIDSLIRSNRLANIEKYLSISLHQFPNDNRFYELSYLIKNDRTLLKHILQNDNSINSLIRLYSRVNNKLSLITLEVIIVNLLDKNSSLNEIHYSYPIISLLGEHNLLKDLNGTYTIDSDSNTFIDTIFIIKNGIIEYKSIDWDGDNIKDFECILENSKPKKLIFKESYIAYNNYPFIDYISVGNENKTIYNLYKSYTKFVIPSLVKQNNIYPNISLINEIKLTNRMIYNNDYLISKWLYKDNNIIYVYTEPNKNGSFDKLEAIDDNFIKFTLRDLNSDGINDYLELFENNEIIYEEFKEFGNKEWSQK